jgi:hypothetical protein
MARKTQKRGKAAPRAAAKKQSSSAKQSSSSKTSTKRLPPPSAEPATTKAGRRLDAAPDRVDIRDWFYQPRLVSLPDRIINIHRVPMVLDQGNEGACTGFALAAVINFLRPRELVRESVSPRMLYEMARRYDEWPGESYEGSSARGGMKGWVRHGVCLESSWPKNLHGARHLTPERAEEARLIPGGAFYRVAHREVRDMHSALAEVGILYMTLMVHDGWDDPKDSHIELQYATESGKITNVSLPVIKRKGRADSGHAVAIVGYTEEGFIIQNSWGTKWGASGFALLPYEDYMLHATDVWAAQIGVPVKVDLWQQGYADTTSGAYRAQQVVPLAEIRPYTIDIGNNGRLSDSGDYWTTEEDVQRLFREIIPEKTRGWSRRRVLFYLHGGLNSEAAVARRIVAFRDAMLENEIYPVHIMWESGVMESLNSIIEDIFTEDDKRAGKVADWWEATREGLIEAKDWSLELTAAVPGTALWNEMKENARLSSVGDVGGMRIVSKHVAAALKGLSPAELKKWELHVVGHSAGAIFAAHAMPLFCSTGTDFKTFQLMAPAMTVELFKKAVMPVVKKGNCPHPELFVLSDQAERDDTVGPYGKSLLYLVSNAFEGRRGTPILGMQRYVTKVGGKQDPALDPEVEAFLDGHVIVANAGTTNYPGSGSETHGGFDNDAATMNTVISRILGGKPKRPFTSRDLQY